MVSSGLSVSVRDLVCLLLFLLLLLYSCYSCYHQWRKNYYRPARDFVVINVEKTTLPPPSSPT